MKMCLFACFGCVVLGYLDERERGEGVRAGERARGRARTREQVKQCAHCNKLCAHCNKLCAHCNKASETMCTLQQTMCTLQQTMCTLQQTMFSFPECQCHISIHAALYIYTHIYIYIYIHIYIHSFHFPSVSGTSPYERWGAGVETQKNVRGEIGGWGRVPFNEPYAPSLSTIYDGA